MNLIVSVSPDSRLYHEDRNPCHHEANAGARGLTASVRPTFVDYSVLLPHPLKWQRSSHQEVSELKMNPLLVKKALSVTQTKKKTWEQEKKTRGVLELLKAGKDRPL